MKRVIVIGCPGSGKSTFARELHKKTGLPLYYLDMMYWNSDRTTVAKEIFLSRLSEVLRENEWIIDGNYASTMEMRVDRCDTVFFLDYPTEVCLEGIEARRGKDRPDMPWVETEADGEFIEFVKSYNTENRPKVLEILEKCICKSVIIFKNRDEAAKYLNNL